MKTFDQKVKVLDHTFQIPGACKRAVTKIVKSPLAGGTNITLTIPVVTISADLVTPTVNTGDPFVKPSFPDVGNQS